MHATRRRLLKFVSGILLVSSVLVAQAADKTEKADKAANPQVLLKTSMGDIVLELYPEKAPKTVENFLQYVGNGHYSGTIFHRVIDNFMIQGGGYDKDMEQKPTNSAIDNEAGNGLKNMVGTVAMARTSSWKRSSCGGGVPGTVTVCPPMLDTKTATSQFFINVADNAFLDRQVEVPGKIVGKDDFGYAVFGRVIKGLDVVEKIKKVPVKNHNPHQNVPVVPIVIESASILK